MYFVTIDIIASRNIVRLNNMRRAHDRDSGSQGISAMVLFIAIVLMSSIIAGVVIGFGEKIFSETKNDAQENVPSVKGLVNIVVLEIFTLGANDEIHIVYELPYIEQSVADEDVSWVVMCTPSGSTRVNFDEGDFTLATDLDGDGLTALPLVEFEPAVTYRMIIQLSDCDLEDVESASLVLVVENGRTQEWEMEIGSSPYQGQDLN